MGNWSVYMLVSECGRTYIGSTTDTARRLRQHNGEIRGGARSTRGRKWKLELFISGFENRSSACRWERIVKCRARGRRARYTALAGLAVMRLCPTGGRGRPHYEVPEGLRLHAGWLHD